MSGSAGVAQLDRAPDYGSGGSRFDSLRPCFKGWRLASAESQILPFPSQVSVNGRLPGVGILNRIQCPKRSANPPPLRVFVWNRRALWSRSASRSRHNERRTPLAVPVTVQRLRTARSPARTGVARRSASRGLEPHKPAHFTGREALPREPRAALRHELAPWHLRILKSELPPADPPPDPPPNRGAGERVLPERGTWVIASTRAWSLRSWA